MKKMKLNIGKAEELTRDQLKKVKGGESASICIAHCACPPGYEGNGYVGFECIGATCIATDGVGVTCGDNSRSCAEQPVSGCTPVEG